METRDAIRLLHYVVLGSGFLAAIEAYICSKHRLLSLTVVASALLWAVIFGVVASLLDSSRIVEHDVGSGIGNAVGKDCCSLLLGGYHILLCSVLVAKIIGDWIWRR